MKSNFLLLFLFFWPFAYGQADTINQTDSNGLKQGFWKVYPNTTNSENYSKKAFLQEGRYCNNQKCGTWISYFDDGKTIKSRCGYVDGELHGDCTSYFENGRIKNQGVFVNGYFAGIHHSYYEDGKLQIKSTYDSNGKETDTSFRYFSDGSLESMTIYDTVNHIKRYIDYEEDGSIRRELMSVDHDIDHSFTLNSINVIKALVSPATAMQCYHFKLNFEGTPIYRDYLLVLKADSTYQLVRYDYESCYNYITTSAGNWAKSGNEIQLFPIQSEVKFDRLVIEPNGNLVSQPILESDRKRQVFTFAKIPI